MYSKIIKLIVICEKKVSNVTRVIYFFIFGRTYEYFHQFVNSLYVLNL